MRQRLLALAPALVHHVIAKEFLLTTIGSEPEKPALQTPSFGFQNLPLPR